MKFVFSESAGLLSAYSYVLSLEKLLHILTLFTDNPLMAHPPKKPRQPTIDESGGGRFAKVGEVILCD